MTHFMALSSPQASRTRDELETHRATSFNSMTDEQVSSPHESVVGEPDLEMATHPLSSPSASSSRHSFRRAIKSHAQSALDHRGQPEDSAAVVTPPQEVSRERLNQLGKDFEKAYKENPAAMDHLDVNVQTTDGDTLVFRFLPQKDLCEQVLQRGAPVNGIRACDGKSCLHLAAQKGYLDSVNCLLAWGADINQLDHSGHSALLDAAQYEPNGEVFLRLLQHATTTKGVSTRWSVDIFEALLKVQPVAVITAYLDSFVVVSERVRNNGRYKCFAFHQMHLIYGPPWDSVDRVPLRVCLKHIKRRDDLKSIMTHPTLVYALKAKISSLGWVLRVECVLYVVLLVAAFIMMLTDNESHSSTCHYMCVIGAGILLVLELKDFIESGRSYLSSFINWVNLSAYIGVIVVSGLTWSSPVAHSYSCLKAVVLILLTACGVEYMRSFGPALLIAMMVEMLRDVTKFLALYMLFQVAFSGAFYLIFRDNPDTQTRFSTYPHTFVATFFMLFGDFDADMFLKETGVNGVVANVLVILFLLGTVIILLNILIAMMSTSYQQVAKSAQSTMMISRAKAVVRVEGLLINRVEEYDALIPPSQSWCKHGAHLNEAQSIANQRGTPPSGPPQERSDGGTGNEATENDDSNVFGDVGYYDKLPLGNVVHWTKLKAEEELVDRSDGLNQRVQTIENEQRKFRDDIHARLDHLQKSLDQQRELLNQLVTACDSRNQPHEGL